MGLTRLFCRHDYAAIERVADGEAEFYELRCQKCGKTKRSGRGEAVSIGSHDIEMGRRPRLPRR